jgi:hypothetical protein
MMRLLSDEQLGGENDQDIMWIILRYLKNEVLGVVPKVEVQCEINRIINPVSASIQKVLFS